MASSSNATRVTTTLEATQEELEEKKGQEALWGRWGLAVTLALVTVGLLYASYFFFIS